MSIASHSHVQAPTSVTLGTSSAPTQPSGFMHKAMSSLFNAAGSLFSSGSSGGIAKDLEKGGKTALEMGAANMVPGLGEAVDAEKLGGLAKGLESAVGGGGGETAMRDASSGSKGLSDRMDKMSEMLSGFQGKFDSLHQMMTSGQNVLQGNGNTPTSMGDVNIQGDSKTAGNTVEQNQAAQMQAQMQTQAKLTNMTNIFQMVTNSLQSIQKAVQDAWSNSKLT